MNMVDVSELKNRSAEELKEFLSDLSKEIFALRNEFKMTRKIEKTHLIKEKKRTRARILTILRQQEIKSAEGTHGKS
jgi:large subunit ribosomal protein L29